jgi:hypothetical protein
MGKVAIRSGRQDVSGSLEHCLVIVAENAHLDLTKRTTRGCYSFHDPHGSVAVREMIRGL